MKKIFNRFTNNLGSMTVEASLIFPLIVLTIVVVIYICILLYQQAYLQSVANNVVERGAAYWSNNSKIEINSDSYKLKTSEFRNSEQLFKTDLYWRITKAGEKEKIKNLKIFAIHKLGKKNILEGEISKQDITNIEKIKDKVDIWVKDYIVYKELNIIINDSYKIPLGDSLKVFGLSDKYNIKVHSKAVINEPIEFIRNADFIGDTLKEYEVTSEIAEKFKETMDTIEENIERFFEGKGGTTD